MSRHQHPEGTRTGDKIRVRDGPLAGTRGVVIEERDDEVVFDPGDGDLITVPQLSITNYSLAARRAWAVMPKRAGRPRLEQPRKQMVSMRIDIELWRKLGEAVESGFVPSREEAVNRWLRDCLNELFLSRGREDQVD